MNFFQIFGFGKSKPMRPEDFTSEEAKAAAAWIETVNPLRGMTATRMQNLYDASRSGDTVHLQWLYQEIEKIDPTLLICQQRRTGALASLDWHISTRHKKRTRGFDETLAQEQADCLELAFGDADQANFIDAVEHLTRGFFRGFAHVLPRWSADGLSVKGFDCLDQWNFVRDNTTGVWYWNPEAHAYTDHADCRPIPKGELVTFVAPYHIDYPAMTIYLRSAVGEKGWAKFVERFGIPPVILTMPQDIPSDQVDVWRHSAEKVAEGGSGAVPAGTGVNFCDGARGINPFKDFIHNQRELIVLMSTGGLLTSLTESGSGTLAGGAHAETWAEVRRMDSSKIGSVLNRTLAETVLDRAFPGRPHLAYFAFDTEAVPSPGEVFDDAAKARASGYLIDKADLEERTGYRLVKDEPSGGQMGLQGGFNGLPGGLANKTPFNPSEKPFKIARSDSDGQGDGSAANALLTAFSRDLGPAAEEVKKLLADLDAGKDVTDAAAALVGKLPELMPEDPAMSAVIAEEMAREFGKVASHPSQESQSSQEPLANEAQHCELDGGWIGDAGCTHPNHQHSALVNRIIDAAKNKKPITITPEQCDAALKEGFYVDAGNGKRIGFGRALAHHFDEDHNKGNEDERRSIQDRKTKLMFAVDAVMHPTRTNLNEEGFPDRKSYIKEYKDFGVKAISSEEGDKIEYVFTFFYNKSMRKKVKK